MEKEYKTHPIRASPFGELSQVNSLSERRRDMHRSYQKLFKKADMSKEQEARIRNYIEGQNKRVSRRKKVMEKHGVSFGEMDEAKEKADYGEATLGTRAEDPLEKILRDMDMERLNECLGKLSEEDRKIILTIYGCDDKKVNIKRAAEILGKPRTTISAAHVRILNRLKNDFFEEN